MKKSILTFLVISTIGLGACSSSNDRMAGEIHDPLEPYNRAVFAVNDGLDTVVLNPVTEAYRFVVPDVFRTGLSNFLTNLKSPVYLVNELLQGDLDGAGLVTKRFVFNTFTGFGGLVDTASWEGMTYEPEDFGQTLAVWGVPSGPYVVLPLLGPSTTRDGFGMMGDMAMDPVNWYIWGEGKDDLGTGRTVASILTTKDNIMDLQKDLKGSSLDYYAAVRSVWMQRRLAMINDGAEVEYEEY
jgi:phospholipid-binding lipoprotein MlaA